MAACTAVLLGAGLLWGAATLVAAVWPILSVMAAVTVGLWLLWTFGGRRF